MAPGSSRAAARAALFLLLLTGLVHAAPTGPGQAQAPRKDQSQASAAQSASPPLTTPPERGHGAAGLPLPVVEMRDAILTAARSGRVEEIKVAIELNEIKPAFGEGPVADPVAHLRTLSADGEGREILAAMASVLEAGWIAVPLGRDIENNRVYVWPHFAETDLASLSPDAEVELYRLVPFAEAHRMRAKGAYDHWRIGIGADGVWHFLRR